MFKAEVECGGDYVTLAIDVPDGNTAGAVQYNGTPAAIENLKYILERFGCGIYSSSIDPDDTTPVDLNFALSLLKHSNKIQAIKVLAGATLLSDKSAPIPKDAWH